MIAIDFYCGAGGLTRGLLNAGIHVRLGVDSNEAYRDTYELNNAPAKFLFKNIRNLSFEEIEACIEKVDTRDLLFAACAPCQPFAKINKSRSRKDEATLLSQFGRFVERFQPDQVFVENVPGLAKVRGRSTYRRFLGLLTNLGYNICGGVLDAKDFGVPQTRRRLIIIAMKKIVPTLPAQTHGPKLIAYETVENAIRAYPPIKAGESHSGIANHQAARLSPKNIERLRHTRTNGGNRTGWPRKLWLKCHKNGHEGHTDVYGRMFWHRPAPALTCKCLSLSNGRYGHPSQNRAISLREAARLQSFGDDYIFYGDSQNNLATQVGNAVPVKLAEVIGKHILSLRQEGPPSKK